MTRGTEQTQVTPREILSVERWINWWGILGVLCMVWSAFFSVKIFFEILAFLKAAGVLRVLAFTG